MSEIHPEKLKFVNVIPIHKKGSQILLSNYRPISLLSNLNKIFEKIIFKRLHCFLEKYNCIFELQDYLSLVRQPVDPTARWSDNPLVRQPVGPTTRCSENPLLREPVGPTAR